MRGQRRSRRLGPRSRDLCATLSMFCWREEASERTFDAGDHVEDHDHQDALDRSGEGAEVEDLCQRSTNCRGYCKKSRTDVLYSSHVVR